jgi:hypothetical protein
MIPGDRPQVALAVGLLAGIQGVIDEVRGEQFF